MIGLGALVWAGVILGALVVQLVHLGIVLAWEDQRTDGMRYFGATEAVRRRYRRALALHRLLLAPVIWLLGRFTRMAFDSVSLRHGGVAVPKGMCSQASVERAVGYAPTDDDVFVVTQMRSGTTWMQQLVLQLLCRGADDLVDSGTPLCALSPWLEARKTVRVEDAPRLGVERPSRLIKTHLPADLCPWSTRCKYIYVCRHPVSCFASCADFVAANAGPFAPTLAELEAWFVSDELMWWGAWPQHVDGWWERSTTHDNVLFVRFEEMTRDLAGVAARVAAFLDLQPLDASELERVTERCRFEFIRTHSHLFTVHPPHLLLGRRRLLVSGRSERFGDVPPPVRTRLRAWCERRTSRFPLARFYPPSPH